MCVKLRGCDKTHLSRVPSHLNNRRNEYSFIHRKVAKHKQVQLTIKNDNIIRVLKTVQLLMKLRLRATECHLPYRITQCYLPSEHTPP